MKIGEFVRQGDLVIRKVASRSLDGLSVKRDGVLAYGEVTGHAHRITGEAVAYELAADRLLVSVVGTAEVVHEEHATQTLDRGLYEVVRQREWTAGDERRVSD